MEYLKGIPFTKYCDDARLPLKDRLKLFVSICQAVQHAHQKGIIHRDLKPSNILVCLYDGQPVPKVIDFGLAKAMHQSLTEHTLHTAQGFMVGAPLEQQQFKNAALEEMLRLIKEVEPPRPSTRISGSASLPSIAAQRGLDPAQLCKQVRGDLDWIVMKSLEKERSRHYETTNGLARDIDRFLHDEPVEACPPSTGYRLRKLLRRHRRSVDVLEQSAASLQQLQSQPELDGQLTIAQMFASRGLLEKAKPHFERALELAREIGGESTEQALQIEVDLLFALANGEPTAGVEARARRVAADVRRVVGEKHPLNFDALNSLSPRNCVEARSLRVSERWATQRRDAEQPLPRRYGRHEWAFMEAEGELILRERIAYDPPRAL